MESEDASIVESVVDAVCASITRDKNRLSRSRSCRQRISQLVHCAHVSAQIPTH